MLCRSSPFGFTLLPDDFSKEPSSSFCAIGNFLHLKHAPSLQHPLFYAGESQSLPGGSAAPEGKKLPWTNSAPLGICVKVWLLATVEVPSQALTASVLDGVESEGWRKWPHGVVLESQNHLCWKRLFRSQNPAVTQGFGKKRRKFWGKCAVVIELGYSGSAEQNWDIME